MSRFDLTCRYAYLYALLLLLLPYGFACAQSTQTVTNGQFTSLIDLNGTGCLYTWNNNHPEIGLAANGTGNIAAFKAVNTGNTTITATITASPAAVGVAYVANKGSGTISVVNTRTNMVINTITVGHDPDGLVVSPDGSRLYVSYGTTPLVTMVNTVTGATTDILTLDGAGGTGTGVGNGIAITPDGSKVYVANFNAGTVTAINTTFNTAQAVTTVGHGPSGIVITPDGKYAYVTNTLDGTTSIINTLDNTVNQTITEPGTGPPGPVSYNTITADGNFIYTGCAYIKYAYRVDTQNNIGAGTWAVAGRPYGLYISPDNKFLYAATDLNYVISYPIATDIASATIPTGTAPRGMTANADGTLLYVANSGSDDITVINTVSNTVAATIPVGSVPVAVATSTANVCSPVTYTINVLPSPVTPPADPVTTVPIPNTFTPNNDGVNDTWRIPLLSNYPNCTVNIFNRFGANIYSSVGYAADWDGRYKGTKLPTGTYYYLIDLKDKSKPLSGSVTLIR